MTADGPEELSQGPDRSPVLSRVPSPPWWVRLLVAALAVIVGGAVLVHQTSSNRPQSSAPVSGPSLPASAEPGFFNVGTICPAVTDRVHTLLVTFTLTNISKSSVTVVRVTPELPLAGLQTVSIDIAGGSCTDHVGAPTGLEVEPGSSLLVTFRFLLPATCPQPLPVQARVDVRTQAAVLREVVPVYPDLGSVPFDTCTSST